MGGAAVAVALEPFGGAVNPGAMSFLDSQWQLGPELVQPRPQRLAHRLGNARRHAHRRLGNRRQRHQRQHQLLHSRVRRQLDATAPTWPSASTVYGNGGMNTDYPGGQIPAQSACARFNPNPGPYNLLCGNGELGVDLMQLMIAPYVSWQFTKGHSIGIAPTLAYQRFKADGLQAFDNPMLSTRPGSVTNNGYSDSWGGGVRIGYMGAVQRHVLGRRGLRHEDEHGRVRRLRGPVRAVRRVRHSVELHPRRGVAPDRPVAARAGLPAHLLQRLGR